MLTGLIVFWKWIEQEDGETGEKKVPFLRYYSVFHIDQCEGISAKHTQETSFPDGEDNLAAALLALKEKERDLIVLHYYSRRTLKAVAEMMGMSYINAKVIHKKTFSRLQE